MLICSTPPPPNFPKIFDHQVFCQARPTSSTKLDLSIVGFLYPNKQSCRAFKRQQSSLRGHLSQFVLRIMTSNPFLLAADNSPELLPLLRENPALASKQDEHGYSLVHAAASYNHINLLRSLIREFKVDVNTKDEDEETALFVVETTDAAKILIEELGADPLHKNTEGMTARQKIEEEADFPDVAAYLSTLDPDVEIAQTRANALPETIPPPPEGMRVTVGTMDESQDVPEEVDNEFRQRIEELAQRADFDTPQGQAELRSLVEDAVADQGIGDERSVRPRAS